MTSSNAMAKVRVTSRAVGHAEKRGIVPFPLHPAFFGTERRCTAAARPQFTPEHSVDLSGSMPAVFGLVRVWFLGYVARH